jgi:hypothetical protein
MWENKQKEFARKHDITQNYAARFQCTAEHLFARCDGGSNQESNIVAACRFCNSTRHKCKKPPTPEKYKSHICKRLKMGKWHPRRLQHIIFA